MTEGQPLSEGQPAIGRKLTAWDRSAPEGWPTTEAEALAVQDALRSRLVLGGGPERPALVAGLDVAYHEDGERLAAAVVVLDAEDHTVRDTAVVRGRAAFPYVPGLFAFREIPALLTALERLTVRPDVLVCDGHGLAHPRRFGLACHLGVLTGLPAFGVGKTPLVGSWEEPGARRGSRSDLVIDGDVAWAGGDGEAGGERAGRGAGSGETGGGAGCGAGSDKEAGGGGVGRGAAGGGGRETVGAVLRTQDGVKPVFVSVGHRTELDAACALTLRLAPRFRLPETTRRADRACRDALL